MDNLDTVAHHSTAVKPGQRS